MPIKPRPSAGHVGCALLPFSLHTNVPNHPFLNSLPPSPSLLPIAKSLSLGKSRSLPLQQDKEGWEASQEDSVQWKSYHLKILWKPLVDLYRHNIARRGS